MPQFTPLIHGRACVTDVFLGVGFWRPVRYVLSGGNIEGTSTGPWWRHQMKTFSALLALCCYIITYQWIYLMYCPRFTSLLFDCRNASKFTLNDMGKTDRQQTTAKQHNILQWRHNERYGVSNHQPHDCLLNRLFRRSSKKTSKFHITGLVRGINRWPVNSPHKGPVTRKMFPFDDVIMIFEHLFHTSLNIIHVRSLCRKLSFFILFHLLLLFLFTLARSDKRFTH